MTEHHEAGLPTIYGLRTVEGPRWLGDDPVGEESCWRGAGLPLPAGTGVCLVRSCGWACCAYDRGQAAWRHTRTTGHPTAYRSETPAGADLAGTARLGVL